MAEITSIFDMIGSLMIGPSSSHTAGVVRNARTASRIPGEPPLSAVFTYYNSFARIYEGHSSDWADIAGLLDFDTDNTQLKDSFTFASEAGLQYTFRPVGNASTLPTNTLKLELTNTSNQVEDVGESQGGVVRIVEVDGFAWDFKATLHTLIIDADNVKGNIAFITSVIADDNCKIAP